MADHEALHDAERLLAEAETFASVVDREIAAMEAAIQIAEEGLARTESTAREAGAHLRWLGDQLDVGRKLQDAASAGLGELAGIEQRLRARIGTGALQASALVVPGASDSATPRVAAALPVFRRTTRAELDQIELRPALAYPEAWRLVAEDHPSLGEVLEAAKKQLEEAEALAEARLAEAERFRREGARRRTTAAKATEPTENR